MRRFRPLGPRGHSHAPRRPRRALPLVPLVLLAAATAAACGNGDDRLSASTRAEVVTLGDSAAMTLVRTLSGRLHAALAEGGPSQAIQFCAGEAQPLTDSVSQSLGPGWEVKRTSLRTRNPKNAPDSLEAAALEYFHGQEAADQKPEDLVQVTPAGDYRFYMPLRVGHLCLQCHGDRESLDPAVRTVLDERYPVDQATGYRQGDLRGLVRVTIPASAVQ